MQNLDMALLRSFVAVAETGQMTAAAKVVNRSQGAVTLREDGVQHVAQSTGCALAQNADQGPDSVEEIL